MTEPTNIKSIRVARLRQAASNELMGVIERQIDAAMSGPDPVESLLSLSHGFTNQLAGALCALLDVANDHSQGVATPAFLRDFLRMVADEIGSQVDDHRANGSAVAAGCCQVTVAELRQCADKLDEYTQVVAAVFRATKGRS